MNDLTPAQEAAMHLREGESSKWRVGRKVGRTIYLNDDLIGIMDTPELASEVVSAVQRVETAEAKVAELTNMANRVGQNHATMWKQRDEARQERDRLQVILAELVRLKDHPNHDHESLWHEKQVAWSAARAALAESQPSTKEKEMSLSILEEVPARDLRAGDLVLLTGLPEQMCVRAKHPSQPSGDEQ